MGYELHREIRAVIPPGKLTPFERHLVLEIADQCGDDSRKTWPGSDLLQLLVDKNDRAIEEALKKIAEKWVELRVELGTGKDGRPYYSHRGKATTFCFPPDEVLRAEYEKATGIPWASSEHAKLPGAIRQPKKTQKKATENPGASADGSDRKAPENSEKAPEFSGESPRESRGPFPQGSSPQNFNTSNPSPLPPTDGTPRTDASMEEGGNGEFDSDQQQRIDTLVAEILNLRPDDPRWTDKTIRAVINKCLAKGKHLDDIERAFPACAKDPETAAPGRLPMDFYWWALPAQRCDHCGGKGEVWSEQYQTTTRCGHCPGSYDLQPRSSDPGRRQPGGASQSSEGRNYDGWQAIGDQIRAAMEDRTPAGGSLGRKFAGRKANYNERL